MADLIRWNANFVRGLAQTVLNRAKVIRMSLEPAKKAAKKAVKKRRKPTKVKRRDA